MNHQNPSNYLKFNTFVFGFFCDSWRFPQKIFGVKSHQSIEISYENQSPKEQSKRDVPFLINKSAH